LLPGVLQIQDSGVAGKLKLRTASELDPSDSSMMLMRLRFSASLGLSMNAQCDLILNTTGNTVTIALPDNFEPLPFLTWMQPMKPL